MTTAGAVAGISGGGAIAGALAATGGDVTRGPLAGADAFVVRGLAAGFAFVADAWPTFFAARAGFAFAGAAGAATGISGIGEATRAADWGSGDAAGAGADEEDAGGETDDCVDEDADDADDDGSADVETGDATRGDPADDAGFLPDGDLKRAITATLSCPAVRCIHRIVTSPIVASDVQASDSDGQATETRKHGDLSRGD